MHGQLITVFDAAQVGYRAWIFILPGIIFVIAGAIMVLTESGKFRSWFFFLFAFSWTFVVSIASYTEYHRIMHALATGNYKTVEGPVTDFTLMPVAGHSMERFRVNNVPFAYSDNAVTSGFNNTASHGGPIHEGVYVRITYIKNAIIKLEVQK